jgi:hypothetical protein
MSTRIALYILYIKTLGHAVAVEELRYEPEGRGIYF